MKRIQITSLNNTELQMIPHPSSTATTQKHTATPLLPVLWWLCEDSTWVDSTRESESDSASTSKEQVPIESHDAAIRVTDMVASDNGREGLVQNEVCHQLSRPLWITPVLLVSDIDIETKRFSMKHHKLDIETFL